MGIVAWLLGSELGRKVAIYGALVLGLLFAIWRIYAAGQSAEQAKQAQASLQNLRKRMETDDEITGLSVDQRRERLSRWMSDGQ